MIIIAGYLIVDTDDRDAFVDAHRDLVTRARAFDGCIDVSISSDPVDPTRINNLEIWRDAHTLDTWRDRADAPDTGIEPTRQEMNRYDASDGGPLF